MQPRMGLQRTPEALIEAGKLREYLDKVAQHDAKALASIGKEFDPYASRRGAHHWTKRQPVRIGKISDPAALWARAAYFSNTSKVPEIAKALGVSGAAIYSILTGRTHRRVEAGYGLPLRTVLRMLGRAVSSTWADDSEGADQSIFQTLPVAPPRKTSLQRKVLLGRVRRALRRIQHALHKDYVNSRWHVVSMESGQIVRVLADSELEHEARALGLLEEWETVMSDQVDPLRDVFQPRVTYIDPNLPAEEPEQEETGGGVDTRADVPQPRVTYIDPNVPVEPDPDPEQQETGGVDTRADVPQPRVTYIDPNTEPPPGPPPVAEEPVAEEPVAEEPVAEEPVAEEPVAEEPPPEPPPAEEPVVEPT